MVTLIISTNAYADAGVFYNFFNIQQNSNNYVKEKPQGWDDMIIKPEERPFLSMFVMPFNVGNHQYVLSLNISEQYCELDFENDPTKNKPYRCDARLIYEIGDETKHQVLKDICVYTVNYGNGVKFGTIGVNKFDNDDPVIELIHAVPLDDDKCVNSFKIKFDK